LVTILKSEKDIKVVAEAADGNLTCLRSRRAVRALLSAAPTVAG
jgi:hypothetical protein